MMRMKVDYITWVAVSYHQTHDSPAASVFFKLFVSVLRLVCICSDEDI